jgi:phosphate starvation-inducible PhoH-like protein
VLKHLLSEITSGQPVFLQEIERVASLFESTDVPPEEDEETDVDGPEVSPRSQPVGAEAEHAPGFHARPPRPLKTFDQRPINAKTDNQQRYLEAIAKHDVTFGIGPAGTGKTYLAVACAVAALKSHEVKRIILTRPAVEAGEKLGFLPGSLVEKVNPYLRPLYDALYEMLGAEAANKAIEDHTIEVAPLAFMRGRTLNRAFVILDEAQNTTPEQMKMFLTRLGYGTQAIITGDVTQTDLPRHQRSGLAHALKVLADVEEIAKVELTTVDVVRHPLVRAIIKAYEADEQGS